MPNIRGGKGYKRGKTGRVKTRPDKAIECVDVSEGEGFYARIKKRLGGKPAKFEVIFSNGMDGEVIARGKMHKKVWINPGMIVLVNGGNEIVKIITDTDIDSKEAKEMMSKVENANSVFSTFFVNKSSDDDDDDIDVTLEHNKYEKNKEDLTSGSGSESENNDDSESDSESNSESNDNSETEKNKYLKKMDNREKIGHDRSKKNGQFNIDDI